MGGRRETTVTAGESWMDDEGMELEVLKKGAEVAESR